MEGPGAQGEAGLNDTKVTSNFPVLRSQFTSFPQGPWPGGSGSPSPIFRDWKCLGQPAYYLAHKNTQSAQTAGWSGGFLYLLAP